MLQLIPLSPSPNQNIALTLNIDGGVITLQLYLHYNELAQYWTISISDKNGNLLLDSIPFVTGNAPSGNILGQYAYLQIGSAYIVNASGITNPQVPDNTNLGSGFALLWGDSPITA